MMRCNLSMRWLAGVPKITNSGITDGGWRLNVELILLRRYCCLHKHCRRDRRQDKQYLFMFPKNGHVNTHSQAWVLFCSISPARCYFNVNQHQSLTAAMPCCHLFTLFFVLYMHARLCCTLCPMPAGGARQSNMIPYSCCMYIAVKVHLLVYKVHVHH